MRFSYLILIGLLVVASAEVQAQMTDDFAVTNEDIPKTFNVTANDAVFLPLPNTVDLNTAMAGRQTTTTTPWGSYAVDNSGDVTFTPNPDVYGVSTIQYSMNYGLLGLAMGTASYTITINSVNDRPETVDDSGTTNEEQSTSIKVLDNDSDVDDGIDPSTVTFGAAVGGTFIADNSGEVTYTPTPNFNGVASVNYYVKDMAGANSNTSTITVTVTPINDAPVAVDDVANTSEGVAVIFSVVDNDTDVDGVATIDPATVDISGGTGGTFVASNAGNVTFTPNPGFNGTATATYTVKDNQGLISNSASITVTVNSVNDAPVAVNDTDAMDEDTAPITISILANDSDPDGTLNPATVVLSGEINGNFEVNGSGVVTYTAPANFHGVASAKYTVKDNEGLISNQATITVTVNSINDAPVATNDAGSTNEGVPKTLNVVSNDTDSDGSIDPTTILTNGGTGGTFTANNAGEVTYTPTPGFNGIATADYTVKDNEGLISNTAQITITVISVNDPPVAADDAASMSEDGSPLTIDILANDSDPDGTINPATVAVSGATNGTFVANATTGVITYTPTANFYGVATAKYTVKDNDGVTSNQATITVTVTSVNDPPKFANILDQRVLQNSAAKTVTITGITAGTLENETLTLNATSNNTALIPNSSPNLTVTYNGTGSTATLKFMPVAEQSGTAVVTVTLTDQGSNVYTSTFEIEVVEVEFTSVPVTVAVPTVLYTYNITITDVTETLSIVATQKPAWATLTPQGKGAKLSGIPPANAPITNVVTLQLKDGATILDQQQYTLIVNRPPTVASFGLTGDEDIAIKFIAKSFEDVYSDPDDQPLSEIQITQLPNPDHGILKLNSTPLSVGDKIAIASISNVTYTSVLNYNGLDTLYYKASDGYSYSQNAAFIHFVIAPVNDVPDITFIEPDYLQYELGSEIPVKVTPGFVVIDVDNADLTSAEIRIRIDGLQPENEQLLFEDTLNIHGSFTKAAGILVLSGKSSVQNYQDAIRTIKYNYIDLELVEPRKTDISFALSDGSVDNPILKSRPVDLIYTFKDLMIPNAFTPTGDLTNDNWVITSPNTIDKSVPYDDAEIRVYNKTGVLVFEAKGFEKPWDGTYDGKELPVDTYYYTIDLKYNRVRYRGVVTILR